MAPRTGLRCCRTLLTRHPVARRPKPRRRGPGRTTPRRQRPGWPTSFLLPCRPAILDLEAVAATLERVRSVTPGTQSSRCSTAAWLDFLGGAAVEQGPGERHPLTEALPEPRPPGRFPGRGERTRGRWRDRTRRRRRCRPGARSAASSAVRQEWAIAGSARPRWRRSWRALTVVTVGWGRDTRKPDRSRYGAGFGWLTELRGGSPARFGGQLEATSVGTEGVPDRVLLRTGYTIQQPGATKRPTRRRGRRWRSRWPRQPALAAPHRRRRRARIWPIAARAGASGTSPHSSQVQPPGAVHSRSPSQSRHRGESVTRTAGSRRPRTFGIRCNTRARAPVIERHRVARVRETADVRCRVGKGSGSLENLLVESEPSPISARCLRARPRRAGGGGWIPLGWAASTGAQSMKSRVSLPLRVPSKTSQDQSSRVVFAGRARNRTRPASRTPSRSSPVLHTGSRSRGMVWGESDSRDSRASGCLVFGLRPGV